VGQRIHFPPNLQEQFKTIQEKQKQIITRNSENHKFLEKKPKKEFQQNQIETITVNRLSWPRLRLGHPKFRPKNILLPCARECGNIAEHSDGGTRAGV